MKKDRNDKVYEKSNKNYEILKEADKRGWKKAVKTKGIYARKLQEELTIITREGEEKGKKGDMLSIGIAGEPWFQKEDKLNAKYEKKGNPVTKTVKISNKESRTFNDFYSYEPKKGPAVLACQIKKGFKVIASWGDLKGKKGDYIVKNFEDELNPDLTDVWIVDKNLFEATYEFIKG